MIFEKPIVLENLKEIYSAGFVFIQTIAEIFTAMRLKMLIIWRNIHSSISWYRCHKKLKQMLVGTQQKHLQI